MIEENVNETLQNEQTSEETTEKKPDKKKAEAKLRAELTAASERADKAEAELAECRDKYLRLAAEYDNFRKRSAKEKESLYLDSVADVITQVLPIFDNLERAAMYEDAEKVSEGLALISKSVDGVLSVLGIEKYGAKGDAFDPNLHNAVMHCEDDSLGETEIAEVFQQGYKKGEKVIRYAMVKVAN